MYNKVKYFLRSLYWKPKFYRSGKRLRIGKNISAFNLKYIDLGDNVFIGDNTYLGPITCYAGERYTPKIIIGDNCIIGKNNSIASINLVKFGNNVLCAGHVHITDHSHGYEDISKPITHQSLISKGPIIIGDDCWLGFSCEILSGVKIGKHSIVAARAVVTKDVPPYTIVAGNPARIVKQYDFDSKTWKKIK